MFQRKDKEEHDPKYIYINYNYLDVDKDFDWTINKEQLEMDKEVMSEDMFAMEWKGKWIKGGGDVYPPAIWHPCFISSIDVELKGDNDELYFGGCDVAKGYSGKGDSFSFSVVKLRNKKKHETKDRVVFSYNARGISEDEMAYEIHKAHERFKLIYLLMDPRGGGHWLGERLMRETIDIEGGQKKVIPILPTYMSEHDGEHIIIWVDRNHEITNAYGAMRGDDVLLAKCHAIMRTKMEKEEIVLPTTIQEFVMVNGNEYPLPKIDVLNKMKVLEAIMKIKSEAGNIGIDKDANGNEIKTANGQNKYIKKGKTDSMMGLIYACMAIDIYTTLQTKYGETESNEQKAIIAIDQVDNTYEEAMERQKLI